MGDSWIERTAIALLLLLLATLGNRQWFRVEYAAAAVATRAESTIEEQELAAPPTPAERQENSRIAAAIARSIEAGALTCPL